MSSVTIPIASVVADNGFFTGNLTINGRLVASD